MSSQTDSKDSAEWSNVAMAADDMNRMTSPSAQVMGDIVAHALSASGRKEHVVLDVACGNGAAAAVFVNMKSGSTYVVDATDFADGMVQATKERLPSLRSVFQADACKLPQDLSAQYDAIVSNFGIFLVPDPEAALNEAKRLLKPGGICAITVWGQDFWGVPIITALAELTNDADVLTAVKQVLETMKGFMDVDRFVKLFQTAGFQQVETHSMQTSSVIRSASQTAKMYTSIPFVSAHFKKALDSDSKQQEFLKAAAEMLHKKFGHGDPIVANRQSYVIVGRL